MDLIYFDGVPIEQVLACGNNLSSILSVSNVTISRICPSFLLI